KGSDDESNRADIASLLAAHSTTGSSLTQAEIAGFEREKRGNRVISAAIWNGSILIALFPDGGHERGASRISRSYEIKAQLFKVVLEGQFDDWSATGGIVNGRWQLAADFSINPLGASIGVKNVKSFLVTCIETCR